MNAIEKGIDEIQKTVAVAETAVMPCHRTLPPLLLDTFLDFNR
jgi:hypothetical protein